MPEQYDTFDASGEQVGYLRLRHNRSRVDFPTDGGQAIFEARPTGDGVFEDSVICSAVSDAAEAAWSRVSMVAPLSAPTA